MYKTIKNFGNFQVNELGEVIDQYGFVRNTYKDRCGYLMVNLKDEISGKWKLVQLHRLVALAFIPNPDCKETVDHINGDKSDNRVSNLRWATRKEQANFNNHIDHLDEKTKEAQRRSYYRHRKERLANKKEYYQKQKNG